MPLMIAVLLAAAVSRSPFQLSATEVGQCGARAVDRNRRFAELDRTDADLAAEQAGITARQAELLEQAKHIDTSKKKQVADYNAQSAAFNASIAAHHDKVVARNAANVELSALIDGYNASCAHKTMNPKDIAALPADQRAALSAGARTSTVMVPAPGPTRRRR